MTIQGATMILRKKALKAREEGILAYNVAFRSLEAWEKVLNEANNGLVEARQLQARDYCSGADFVLDIIEKYLQEVEK